MPERILVVDDERPIADILRYNLEKEGYEVSVAFNGQEALDRFDKDQPSLVILDIMLPRLDGFAVCQKIRERSSVPIIMLTAKEAEDDKVRGLELGADDYVTKPFSPRELLARVRAIFRRAPADAAEQNRTLTCGDLELDMANYSVRKRGKPVELTVREFELLKHLLLHRGKVFTREELLQQVWGYEYFGDIRTVDVSIRRLREKIEDNPSQPRYVLTRRGVGYLIDAS
ncbi:MAG: response regulator transcription factor [Clostridia bacterium]|nr:response regulator transcription factor [Clostridia bacterium]